MSGLTKTSFAFSAALTALALGACGPIHQDEGIDPPLPDHEASCTGEPGLPGATGGAGGGIFVRFGALQGLLTQLASAMRVEGGAGGLPGAHGLPLPPPERRVEGSPGQRGMTGSAHFEHVPGFALDLTGVAQDDLLHASAGQLTIKTRTLDYGPLRIKRLIVDPGVTLKLSGGWIIEADEVLVGPGAAIIVSDRGERTQNVLGNTVGDEGGTLVLRARKLDLLGDLVVSGRAGEQGQPGHPGGRLELELGELRLGPGVVLDASGGAGGQGKAGRSCY